MEIIFLGIGGVGSYPAVFCNCRNCIKTRKFEEKYQRKVPIIINKEVLVDYNIDIYLKAVSYNIDLA